MKVVLVKYLAPEDEGSVFAFIEKSKIVKVNCYTELNEVSGKIKDVVLLEDDGSSGGSVESLAIRYSEDLKREEKEREEYKNESQRILNHIQAQEESGTHMHGLGFVLMEALGEFYKVHGGVRKDGNIDLYAQSAYAVWESVREHLEGRETPFD